MIANISHRGSVVDAIDFYCGYGGSAQGIIAAGADIKAAANHNQLAIECYSANYPTATTYRADLVDPDSGGERAGLGMNELATATVDRIRRALAKFSGTPPFIIPTKSVWGTDRSVIQPFTAQTTQQDKAVVSAIIKNNGAPNEAKYRALSPAKPLGAFVSRN